ncbi:MAG: DUF3301 domain-containing protein [Proteobacteria bacterium]|nr:DUF3301 domain-containing protein [Pseudomonadota bacterium]
MPGFELISLVVIGGVVWLWFDSLKARDSAIAAARNACAMEGLLLLDDTVAIASLKPARDGDGQLKLRRVYEFEYSDTGNNRRQGSMVLQGHRVLIVNIGLRLVPDERVLH